VRFKLKIYSAALAGYNLYPDNFLRKVLSGEFSFDCAHIKKTDGEHFKGFPEVHISPYRIVRASYGK